jgi:hypothetical protein
MIIADPCKDCGHRRTFGPCFCSFQDNGVAAYYQRRHRERMRREEVATPNPAAPPPRSER